MVAYGGQNVLIPIRFSWAMIVIAFFRNPADVDRRASGAPLLPLENPSDINNMNEFVSRAQPAWIPALFRMRWTNSALKGSVTGIERVFRTDRRITGQVLTVKLDRRGRAC